jgi:hypothetical protein
VAIVIGGFVVNFPTLITGEMTVLDYGGLLILVFLVFPFGIVVLVTPFLSKIVVSPEGLEYYTVAYIIRLNWADVVDAVYRTNGYMDKTTILIPRHFEVIERAWAKLVPWDLAYVMSEGIPISRFGGFRGKRLKSDIQKFVPHLNI